MQRQLHIDQLHRLVDRALSSGAKRLSIGRVRWDISGTCDSPYVTEIYSRPSGEEGLRKINNRKRRIVVGRYSMAPMTLEILTPCRKCARCKSHRQRLWTARAYDEARYAARTWFGTLTLRPEAWYHAISQCRAKEALQGVDYDKLPEAEKLALIHARVGSEVTKMLKRIRTLVPSGMVRFLVVLEVTKAGVIHYHCLAHEVTDLHPLRHAQLKDQWQLGFSKWRLLGDPKEAGYVAKYLSKSLLARVRASEGYGQGATIRPQGIVARKEQTQRSGYVTQLT